MVSSFSIILLRVVLYGLFSTGCFLRVIFYGMFFFVLFMPVVVLPRLGEQFCLHDAVESRGREFRPTQEGVLSFEEIQAGHLDRIEHQ
jgi:hypothetical protein